MSNPIGYRAGYVALSKREGPFKFAISGAWNAKYPYLHPDWRGECQAGGISSFISEYMDPIDVLYRQGLCGRHLAAEGEALAKGEKFHNGTVCSCGIWAYSNAADIVKPTSGYSPEKYAEKYAALLVKVEGFGNVVEGTTGYRFQNAIVRELTMFIGEAKQLWLPKPTYFVEGTEDMSRVFTKIDTVSVPIENTTNTWIPRSSMRHAVGGSIRYRTIPDPKWNEKMFPVEPKRVADGLAEVMKVPVSIVRAFKKETAADVQPGETFFINKES